MMLYGGSLSGAIVILNKYFEITYARTKQQGSILNSLSERSRINYMPTLDLMPSFFTLRSELNKRYLLNLDRSYHE